MSERRGKKRPKSYYRKSSHSKRQKLNSLGVGMKGFLVTCNNNEKQAVRESYNILNEYADEMYGSEQIQGKKDADSDMSDSDDEEDMEKAMAKEVKALKEQQTTRRFQNTDTNAKNCIFIRTTLEDPTELHHKIFTDLFEKKVCKARFAMRMLPIAGSCKAVLSEVKTLAEQILPKFFPTESGKERTYSVIFKVRNNNGICRDTVLPMLGEVVKSLNPLNRVNCDNPDVAILVEVICSICCMGVCTDFYKFRKCNFHEVVKDAKKLETVADLKEGLEEKQDEKKESDENRDLSVGEVTGDSCEIKSVVTMSAEQENKKDSIEDVDNEKVQSMSDEKTEEQYSNTKSDEVTTNEKGKTESVEVTTGDECKPDGVTSVKEVSSGDKKTG